MTECIRMLNFLAKQLKKKRVDAGALTLASTDVRFIKDEENQDPVDVEMYETKETNSLVEEFMLLANISVAKQITKYFPAFAMLRRHPDPRLEMFEQLKVTMKRFGVELDTTSSKTLSDSLDMATAPSKSKDDNFNKLLRIMVTRCMNQARYFSSGSVSPALFRHYGLAVDIYTHFTSPIRRYADVIVRIISLLDAFQREAKQI
jgi:exosome complex exonuclease DIS3/RRP44